MFEVDHSAARGKMSTRELFVFKHESELGNCPAISFLINKSRKREGVIAPRAYTDCCNVDEDSIPKDVTMKRMI